MVDMTDLATVPLISADSHVEEPHDLWWDRLPAGMRELAPRKIEAAGEGGWGLVLNGEPMGWGPGETQRLAALSVEHRYEVMREDGISAECVFPTVGLYIWNLKDPEVGRACCEIYNDWILDTLESRSARFRCAGLVPTWDISDAVREVERIAARGLGGAMIPLVGTPEWNHTSWEPLWEALACTGLPVVAHQGTGHDMIFYRGPGAAVANLLATQSMAPRCAGLLATSGVLERYPELHFVFVEVNAGWMAWAMETLDYYYDAFTEIDWVNPRLADKPSAYVARQVHATFQVDRVALDNRHRTGAAALLWGSDYPHSESTYPHSRATIAELFAGVEPDVAAQILGGTAMRLFHFAPEVATTPV